MVRMGAETPKMGDIGGTSPKKRIYDLASANWTDLFP